MSRLLLTGGAGFIGSALARALLADGWEVVVLDRLSTGGRREHLHGLPCELIKGDIRDAALVARALQGVSAVVHAAAESHVTRSFLDPSAFVATNIEGTEIVLDAARRAGVPRFLHLSTDEVFGSAAPGQSFKAQDPLRPGNPYAATKAGAEALILAWRHTYGYPASLVRCTNNYGPRQHPEKAVPCWILGGLGGGPVWVQGEGRAVRDWLHVEDFARGVVLALRHWRPAATWHFAGRQHRENRQIAGHIARLLGAGPLEHRAERPGQDTRYDLDDTETRAELGWAPRVALEQGLEESVAWYRAHQALWAGEAA